MRIRMSKKKKICLRRKLFQFLRELQYRVHKKTNMDVLG